MKWQKKDDGGYLMPEEFRTQLLEAALERHPMVDLLEEYYRRFPPPKPRIRDVLGLFLRKVRRWVWTKIGRAHV